MSWRAYAFLLIDLIAPEPRATVEGLSDRKPNAPWAGSCHEIVTGLSKDRQNTCRGSSTKAIRDALSIEIACIHGLRLGVVLEEKKRVGIYGIATITGLDGVL